MRQDRLPPSELAPLARATGSPFVLGRPLRASEPIFGRDAAFRFIAGELAKFSSVNVVGERRMGKTSLLNHLVGNQADHIGPQPDEPPLIMAGIDLQREITQASRFYGTALRELLARLPSSRSIKVREQAGLRERLSQKPEATYDEFERVLGLLRNRDGVCIRPVIVIDEFERLLEPSARDGFPYPGFYNGIRALMTASLVAMVVASRRPLADYFTDPTRSNSLTSTFPTYLTPFTLGPLDDGAADELLFQPSDHPLALAEAADARRWACGHPCHLQIAGEAWYHAKSEGRSKGWMRKRREELKRQNCMVVPLAPPSLARIRKKPGRLLRVVYWSVPLSIGQLAQRLGAKINDMVAWIIGVALIILVVLLLLGVVTSGELLNALKKLLGLQ